MNAMATKAKNKNTMTPIAPLDMSPVCPSTDRRRDRCTGLG
ncbi:hypothetical protein ACWG8W_08145 [Citricoccus zhacaiensis]